MFYIFKQYLSLSKIMIKNEFGENFGSSEVDDKPTYNSECKDLQKATKQSLSDLMSECLIPEDIEPTESPFSGVESIYEGGPTPSPTVPPTPQP